MNLLNYRFDIKVTARCKTSHICLLFKSCVRVHKKKFHDLHGREHVAQLHL